MAKPTGTVYLCANALIDNNYSSTIDFKNPSEQYAYWGNLVKFSISNFSYIRRTQQFLKIHKPLKDLDDVNYMFFRAEEDSKLYYCFITSKEYIDDSSSYLYFETDVLQTYMFDWELKTSYVVQEHVDRWNVDHTPIYSRTDEGLAYGSEYTTESAYRIKTTNAKDLTWYLAVLKPGFAKATGEVESDITITSGSSDTNVTELVGVCNPYTYFLIPATPYGNDVVIYYNNGHETFQTCDIHRFSKIMARSSLGAFVLQVIRLPYLPIKHSVGFMGELDYGGADPNDYYVKIVHNGINYTEFNVNGLTGPQCFIRLDGIVNSNGLFYNKTLAEMGLYEGLENTLPTAEQWAEVKANPYNIERDRRFESKLLCYPYRYNVLTDWKNQPIILKNEYIGSDKITVKYTQGIGFNAPARYWVDKYRKDPEGRFNSLIQLAQEDVPVITDAYYNYMLQNRNQLQADRTNALVSIAGNTLSGTVNGAIAGGSAGGIPGALFGGLTSGVGAMFSGGINYSNMIRDQQAKQGDLKNLPDTIVNNNDTAFSVQDNNKHICLYRKKICCEFEEMLADVFNTSGYTVNRMKVPNLRSRLRYNYIKTMGANIVGSFNQEDLAKIKAIFNNGVTFWHYNTVNFKPFDYSLENIETSLI